MNTRHEPTTIATLGDIIDHGYRLYGFCPICNKDRVLDVPAIAERLGRGWRGSDHGGVMPLRCECKQRGIRLLLEPPHR